MNGFIAAMTVAALFILYCASDHPDRECLLFAAVIVAIGNSADRIADRLSDKARS